MSTVTFTFDGVSYQGTHGELLAAALLRNGIVHVTDSAYRDRPRGIVGLWVEEPNALVNVDSGAGEPMVAATTVELVDGLVVRSLAGVGDLPDTRDTSRYDRTNRHVDVLVVGAGSAGLMAAAHHAAAGRSVVVCDDKPGPGGHLRDLGQSPDASLLAVLDLPNVTYLPRTTVIGLYDQGYAVAVERRTDHRGVDVLNDVARIRTWHLRAEHTVLAPGAFQRHLVFGNNDRPGIMLSHAAATYVAVHGATCFRRAVVVTVDNQGYRDALRLHRAGVEVVAVLDVRAAVSATTQQTAIAPVQDVGIPVLMGQTALDTLADDSGRVAAVIAGTPDGTETQTLHVDLVAVSGGWTPTVHLATYIGLKAEWDEKRAAFTVAVDTPLVSTAGMLAGDFGSDDEPAAFFGPALTDEQALTAFVDFQRDATYRDVKRAVGAGMHSIEHVKRYTAIGTAHDQGKTSGTLTMGLIAQRLSKRPDEVGSLTFRPPYITVPFAALAGRDRGQLLDPVRVSQLHARYRETPMEDVGQWKRPWYFPQPGESMHDAVRRECRAARTGVAMMDASTLGKIDIQGPDAAEFLDRVYTNVFSSLKVGASRYGFMCGVDGMVFDDGVTTRLAENHFLMTTTTGGAAKVLDWLEEWLYTEWTDLRVYCTSVTEHISTIAVVGPKSRDVIGALCPDLDVSNDGFGFMENRYADVAGVPARIARISFSGELAYEINVESWYGAAVWDAVREAGAPFGITPYGTETLHVLRAEKGYVILGQDTDLTQTPMDLGMDWIVSKKKDFIGKRSFTRSDTSRPGRHQLVGFLPQERETVLPEGAYVVNEKDGHSAPPLRHVGYITSSYFSDFMDRSFALGMLADGRNRIGDTVAVPFGGRVVLAEVCDPVFIDKENSRRDG